MFPRSVLARLLSSLLVSRPRSIRSARSLIAHLLIGAMLLQSAAPAGSVNREATGAAARTTTRTARPVTPPPPQSVLPTRAFTYLQPGFTQRVWKSIRSCLIGFTYLQPGFTQELTGVSSLAPGSPVHYVFGGVAFAADGDPVVADSVAAGQSNQLHRFDLNSAGTVSNGTRLYPETLTPTDPGGALVNHPNGKLYLGIDDAVNGVAEIDPTTFSIIRRVGPRGVAHSLAVDPQTNHLIYPDAVCATSGSACRLVDLDPVSGNQVTFASLNATQSLFTGGLAFDPAGNFIFLADRNSAGRRLLILNRQGQTVQSVPVNSEPVGLAFHVTGASFVVTNNADGTMTRLDFPGNDYAQQPTASLFASGGFPGELMQVGPDGALCVTQHGTRYNDGTISDKSSLVRISSGFAIPPGIRPVPTSVVVTPVTATSPAGTMDCAVATVTDQYQKPMVGISVNFVITGANATTAVVTTDVNGQAQLCYSGANAGTDAITASVTTSSGSVSGSAAKTWSGAAAAASVVVTPKTASGQTGQQHCVIALLKDQHNNPAEGVSVSFSVTGASATTGTMKTDARGGAAFCWLGSNAGTDSVSASAGSLSDTATKTWSAIPAATGLTLSPKPATHPVGTTRCVVAAVTDQNQALVRGKAISFSVRRQHCFRQRQH